MPLSVYVNFTIEWEPVAMIFRLFAECREATLVDQLIDAHGVEATITVVGRVDDALRALKETEHTLIGIVFEPKQEHRAEVTAFAARYPERVQAWPILAHEDEENASTAFFRTMRALQAKEQS